MRAFRRQTQHRRTGPSRPEQPKTISARARLAISMIPKAVQLVWKATPGFAVVNALTSVLQGIVPAVAIYFSMAIVDGVVAAAQSRAARDASHVLWLVLVWFAIQLLGSLLSTVAQVIRSLQSDLLSNHISIQLMQKANTLDLAHFENAQFYDKLENARREATYRPGQMVSELFSLVRSGVTLIAVIGVLASLSWWLVGLVLIVSVPAFLYQAKYSGRFFELITGRAPDQRKLQYLNYLLTTDTPVKELRIFGLHSALLERYREIFTRFYRENRDLTLKRSTSQFILGALGTIMAGATYGYVALLTISGQLTIGQLTLYYQAFQQSQGQISNILSSINSVYESALFLGNLFEFFAFAPAMPVPSKPRPMPRPIRNEVALENVSFRYPGTEKWVLQNISFSIRPGEAIALVGANGAGKTTLVKLLTRLYDPTEGRITVDGIDLKEFDPVELRSRIGVIFQDYMRYQLTVRENIGFGRVEALDDLARIERSAAKAGADTVIAGLPEGYSTPLGRWFHEGQELSIGQWQKIAIARAFMRDADLLILDEPTSSLDVQSEFEVFQAFGHLTEGKMAVLISHRFSTVRMAQRIVVIEEGTALEIGSHDELVQRGGRYAELFDMQAASYR